MGSVGGVGRRVLRKVTPLGLAAGVALLAPGAAPAAGPAGAKCSETEFPVQLAAAQRTLRGTLCRPARGGVPRAAIVLLHGATYQRGYWDSPHAPSRHSALRILARAGHLTLALDRLGSGTSDRPPVAEATADAAASALHQVVERLRSDPATRTGSGSVLLVGHSSGSVLALREAAQYGDVDGLVLTGFLHSIGPGVNLFGAIIHAAADDPAFAGDPSVPAGYVTTQPGTRIGFYYPFNASEQVVRLDEQTKDAMPGGDTSFVEERDSGAFAQQVDVPVLVITGTHDLAFCTPPSCPEAAGERMFYPAAPSFEIIARPRTGHNLHLHANARGTTEAIRRWADRRASLTSRLVLGSSPFGAGELAGVR